jgi:hypothetical protein
VNKTAILDLCKDLAQEIGDSTTLGVAYDDVMERLAKTTVPFVDTASFTPTDGSSTYPYPASAVEILGVFNSGKQLPYAVLPELEAYDDAWRTTDAAEDTPIAYSVTEKNAREIRLFPTPNATDVDGGAFLFSELREDDIPDFLVLPVVFMILSEEFAYPSDHQDLEFAKVCASVAAFFRQLVRL